MLSRFLLILAGLFAGMWFRDASGTLLNIGFPALSLVSLLFAVAAAPTTIDRDARARLEDAYRQWLDAWQRLRVAPNPTAEQALASAANAIALIANDRVVKSLQTAIGQDLTPSAVANLVLDMRRSLRRAGVSVKASDLESILATPGAATDGKVVQSRMPVSAPSFLG